MDEETDDSEYGCAWKYSRVPSFFELRQDGADGKGSGEGQGGTDATGLFAQDPNEKGETAEEHDDLAQEQGHTDVQGESEHLCGRWDHGGGIFCTQNKKIIDN